jgi:tRNA-Thr(GGU) m(6)t(6)A37 methyltransferase TsaA
MRIGIMTGNNSEKKGSAREIVVEPVGVIKNDLPVPPLVAGNDGLKINEAFGSARERMHDTHDRVSIITLSERFTGLLDGIDEYSHIIILYWGHEVPGAGRNLEKIHPAGRTDYQKKGIYATCSPARPNPVLVTVVRLLQRDGNRLVVRGLDAIDNSPVLDIKPYVPEMYPHEGVRIPDWMEKLMKEFRAGRAGTDA